MPGIPVFDNVKCTRCGLCADICPRDFIKIENSGPLMLTDECLLCSHCYSVCPEEAIQFEADDLRNITFESFPYAEKMFRPGDLKPSEFVNILRSRRSVRKYKKNPVDEAVLRDLLNFAVSAPSGSNCQPTEFLTVNGRDQVWDLALQIKKFYIKINRFSSNFLIRNLYGITKGRPLKRYHENFRETIERAIRESENGRDLLFHSAPCVVIFHSPTDASTPLEDAVLCSYNFALLAHCMGLGTCYIGYAVESINRAPFIKKYLGIPADNRVHAVLTAGSPSAKFLRQSLRKPFKAAEFTS